MGLGAAMFADDAIWEHEPEDPRPRAATAIVYCFAICMCCACIFLLISLWFAIHAAVIASSCTLCLQMQSKFLRDMPTGTETDAARKHLLDYEETDVDKQLRIPFIDRGKQFLKNVWKGKPFKEGKIAMHFTPDALEHYYANENMEAENRRAHQRNSGVLCILLIWS